MLALALPSTCPPPAAATAAPLALRLLCCGHRCGYCESGQSHSEAYCCWNVGRWWARSLEGLLGGRMQAHHCGQSARRILCSRVETSLTETSLVERCGGSAAQSAHRLLLDHPCPSAPLEPPHSSPSPLLFHRCGIRKAPARLSRAGSSGSFRSQPPSSAWRWASGGGCVESQGVEAESRLKTPF